MQRLQEKYHKVIVPKLIEEVGLSNALEAPRLSKIIVHMSLGRVQGNKEEIEKATQDLTVITGQKPVVTRAKKAIAGFKLKQGDKIGAKVTLRGARMWDFADKLFTIVLPRTRDFQGLPQNGFDRAGNYTFGINEQGVFMEIDANKLDKARGMQITLVAKGSTSAPLVQRLFKDLGLPLQKD